MFPSLPYVDRPQDSGTQCLSSGLDWKKSLLVWRWEKNIRSVQGQWPISYNPDQFRPQKSLWSRSGPAGRVSVAPLLAHPFNSHHRAMWRICYDRRRIKMRFNCFLIFSYTWLASCSGWTVASPLTSGALEWMDGVKWLSLTKRSITPAPSPSIIQTRGSTGQTTTTSCSPTWTAHSDAKVSLVRLPIWDSIPAEKRSTLQLLLTLK